MTPVYIQRACMSTEMAQKGDRGDFNIISQCYKQAGEKARMKKSEVNHVVSKQKQTNKQKQNFF